MGKRVVVDVVVGDHDGSIRNRAANHVMPTDLPVLSRQAFTRDSYKRELLRWQLLTDALRPTPTSEDLGTWA